MRKPSRKRRRPSSAEVVIDGDGDLPPLSPAEVERINALPPGTPDRDSPALGAEFFARAKPTHQAIPSWPIRPAGRPAKGVVVPATKLVGLRLPLTLCDEIERRARKMHVSFSAALQLAATAWVQGSGRR